MSLDPVRLGVVGCEVARASYHEAIMNLPEARVTALTDDDPRYARVWARQLGTRPAICADISDLLTKPVDAILVTTSLHKRPLAIAQILQAGIPVLSEAPFSTTLEDTDELLAHSKKAGVILMPAIIHRFDPAFLKLIQLINEGVLGTLQQTRCTRSIPLDSDLMEGDILSGGWNGLLMSAAYQSVDVCSWWNGNPCSISADLSLETLAGVSIGGRRRNKADTPEILLITHLNSRSTHQINRTHAVRPEERYFVIGSKGNAELIVSAGASAATSAILPRLTVQALGKPPQSVMVELEEPEADYSSNLRRSRRMLHHYIKCVQRMETPYDNGHSVRTALETVHASYLSAEEKHKVSLPLRRNPDISAILRGHSSGLLALPSTEK